MMGALLGTVSAGRFYIMIGADVLGMFMDVGGLSLETDIQQVSEGGVNGFVHKLPGRTSVGNITLKRGVTRSAFLYYWYLGFISGQLMQRFNVSVMLFDPLGIPQRTWEFRNAFPVRWTGPTLESGSTQVAVESFELAHEGLLLPGV
jgi:phage tail-like protein